MNRKRSKLFIKILCVIVIHHANKRQLNLNAESFGEFLNDEKSSNNGQFNEQLSNYRTTSASCTGCIQHPLEVANTTYEPLGEPLRDKILNHRPQVDEFREKSNQIFSRRHDDPDELLKLQYQNGNESFRLNTLNDSYSRTIYLSLVKILYQLLNKDQQKMEDRADKKNLPLFESAPNSNSNTNPPSSNAQTTQSSVLPTLPNTMDFFSEPLQTEFNDQPNGIDLSTASNTSAIQSIENNQPGNGNRLGSLSGSSNTASQERWSTNRADKKFNFQQASGQPVEALSQQQPQPFSHKVDDNQSQKPWRLSSSKQTADPIVYNQEGLGKPLFTFSTSNEANNFNEDSSGTFNLEHDVDQTGGLPALSDISAHNSAQRKILISDSRLVNSNEPVGDDSYESVNQPVVTTRPRSRPQQRSRSQSRQIHQKINSPTYSGGYPLTTSSLKDTETRYMRTSDQFNPYKQPLIYADQQENTDTEKSYRPNEYQDPQRPQLEHTNIHLQQIYPNPISANNLGYQQYQQQQLQQQQAQQQQMLYSLANTPTAAKMHTNSRSNIQSSNQGGNTASSSNNYDQTNQASSSSNQQQQRDLLNQPQTIQITAVPNGGFNTQPVVRVNGALGVNGLVNNGLYQPGYMDAFGRPLLMLNAERRQIDWSVWIWPLLIAVSLPILLGALFVPIFLKTVIVLIQVLQSLGLLQPITNALTQQISKASGVATSNPTIEQVKT